jgi:hypothetical protein
MPNFQQYHANISQGALRLRGLLLKDEMTEQDQGTGGQVLFVPPDNHEAHTCRYATTSSLALCTHMQEGLLDQ